MIDLLSRLEVISENLNKSKKGIVTGTRGRRAKRYSEENYLGAFDLDTAVDPVSGFFKTYIAFNKILYLFSLINPIILYLNIFKVDITKTKK